MPQKREVQKQAAQKPRQSRAIKTRQRILDAASLLLAESGYPGLNTNAVALKAGVNVSTVYANFANKEEILESLMQEFSQLQISLFINSTAQFSSKTELMNHMLDEMLKVFVQQPWRMALQDAVTASPALQQILERHWQHLITEIAANFPASSGGLKVSGKQQKAVLTLALKTILEGLRLAAKAPKAERAVLMQELKHMLNTYLNTYR